MAVVLVAALAAVGTGERVACRPGHVPSLEVTYTGDSLSGSPICEPCLEPSTAYYGNNLNLAPSFGVKDFPACRTLCQGEERCLYFTYDSENAWCYLKSAKTAKTAAEEEEKRYTSGPRSEECQSEEENEIKDIDDDKVTFIEEDRAAFAKALDQNLTDNITEITDVVTAIKKKLISEVDQPTEKNETIVSKPILSVFHSDGSRTVLSALPANFGLSVINETKVEGRLVMVPSSLCSVPDRPAGRMVHAENTILAAVHRGGCKFAQKALNAARAGFSGLVIMDDAEDTDTPLISGSHSKDLNKFPVIFLLRTEARILERHLKEANMHNLAVAIQDSSSFSWYSRSATTKTKRPSRPTWPFRRRFSTSTTSSSKLSHRDTVFSHPQGPSPRGSVLQMSPLTLGSLITGAMVLLLLVTSVTTLLVSRYTRKQRRRANHTRCQLAIRNMEAQGGGAHDNSGYSRGEEARGSGLPKAARNLLECPVCLELAWPPRRIYQCREGHIICEVCKANPALKVCPMCRIPLANNLTSRNRQLEELARSLQEDADESADEGMDPPAPPSAPPLPPLPPSPPPPADSPPVVTVTTSVAVEPPPGAQGPLTVVLPPEFQPRY